jgi:hypothetical protein
MLSPKERNTDGLLGIHLRPVRYFSRRWSLAISAFDWNKSACQILVGTYVCMFMYIFRPGGHWPRKVSYWSTGRAELNYLQSLPC